MIRLYSALWVLPFFLSHTFCLNAQPKDAPQLVAVLVVGHVEEETNDHIEQMNRVANFFTAHGVKVHKFYDKKAQWKNIFPVARDCHFFVYSGHGGQVNKALLPGMLSIDTHVSSDDIRNTLTFNKKALVIFNSVCFAAGSSASDAKDIGFAEAKRRVLSYAGVFLEVGASAYYAVNYQNTVVKFLKSFFNGSTLRQACLENIFSNCTIETEAKHPIISGYAYSIVSNKGSGLCTSKSYIDGRLAEVKNFPCFKEYNIAFVGPPNFLLSKFQ